MVITRHPAAPGEGFLVECAGLLIFGLHMPCREKATRPSEQRCGTYVARDGLRDHR